MLFRGTLDAVARYRQLQRMMASAVTVTRQRVRKEFREAMEKDFSMAGVSGKLSVTSGGGNGGTIQAVYSKGGTVVKGAL